MCIYIYIYTHIHISDYIDYTKIWSRSKGPCKGLQLRRPPGFQHQTPRKFFFPFEFAKENVLFAKIGRLRIKEFR